MQNKTRKLQVDITGRCQRLWTDLFLRRKAKKLGLNLHGVKHASLHKSEVLVSGEQVSLWKFVKSSKNSIFFMKTDKVEFKFVD